MATKKIGKNLYEDTNMKKSAGLHDDGVWVTIKGTHVFIQNGKVVKGPKNMIGQKYGSESNKVNSKVVASKLARDADWDDAIHREDLSTGFFFGEDEYIDSYIDHAYPNMSDKAPMLYYAGKGRVAVDTGKGSKNWVTPIVDNTLSDSKKNISGSLKSYSKKNGDVSNSALKEANKYFNSVATRKAKSGVAQYGSASLKPNTLTMRWEDESSYTFNFKTGKGRKNK